jgi:hypothetical protein
MELKAKFKPTQVLPLWHFMFANRADDEEKAYREHYLSNDIRQINAITLATTGFMFALTVVDIPLLASNAGFQLGFLLRTTLMFLGLVLIAVMRKFRSPTVLDWGSIAYATGVAIAIVIFHSIGEISAVRIVTVVTVFIFVTHIAYPNYGIWMLLPVLILIFGEGFVIFSSTSEEIIASRSTIAVAAVFATYMGITASAYHHRARFQSFQAISKVKILTGMLPICASCKKIRDDQGYYQQIERYITLHSDAEFSHGLCPECINTLYPELFADSDT